MWAVSREHTDIVKRLIDAGADVRAPTRSGDAPSNWPIVRRSEQRAWCHGDHLGGFTPILFAARVGSVDQREYLLAAGRGCERCAPDGASALVLGCA